jgi:DNA-binding MarR family transcriptional regulator
VAEDDAASRWLTISTAVRNTQRLVNRSLEQAGTPPEQLGVLQLLLRADGHRMPMSALAREVSMTPGGFTKLADRMARDGLIDRRGSVDDRRVVHATLTEAGVVAARQAVERYVAALREHVLDVLGPTELDVAAAALEPLLDVDHDAHDHSDEVIASDRSPQLPDRRTGE